MPGWRSRRRTLGQWVDPRGIVVLIDRACWHGHILAGHPEMPARLDWLAATIEAPDAIYESSYASTRHCFYRRGVIPEFSTLLVKVVVEMYGARAAEVRTAHLVKSVTLGEVQLWP